MGFEPVFDVAGAVADVTADPVADGSPAVVAPSVDRGDRYANWRFESSLVDLRVRESAFAKPLPRCV